jgi:hypothetical protein
MTAAGGARLASRRAFSSLEAPMSVRQARLDPSAPSVPLARTPWFVQMMMIFAVLALVGIVYGFWQIAGAESVPPAGTDAPTQQQSTP